MDIQDCWINGEIRPLADAVLPISDLGLIHGASVTEQLRTFGGRPFLLDDHLKRLTRGTQLLKIRLRWSRLELHEIVCATAKRFLERNRLDDCGIGILVTPGMKTVSKERSGPWVCIYAYRLNRRPPEDYSSGVSLSVSAIQDTSQETIPKNVKLRSRAHYYLAELYKPEADAIPLLLNQDKNLTDTPIAAPVFLFTEGLITIAKPEEILDSITLSFIVRLAEKAGLRVERRSVPATELNELKGAALAGSLIGWCPVQKIDDIYINPEIPEWSLIRNQWIKETGFEPR